MSDVPQTILVDVAKRGYAEAVKEIPQTTDPHVELLADIAWAQRDVDNARGELEEAELLLATLHRLLVERSRT